jgi:hypothetical protein
MFSSISKLTAIALASVMSVASVIPVQAQDVTLSFGERQRVVQTYCDRNPYDYDCRGYHGGYWRNRDYDDFYYSRRSDMDALAVGIFGLAFGAIIGSAIANSNNSRSNGDRVIGRVDDGSRVIGRLDRGHVARCYARYKSYDERTDTFMGYDGIRRLCNL